MLSVFSVFVLVPGLLTLSFVTSLFDLSMPVPGLSASPKSSSSFFLI